jgi:hypothetical protein
MLILNKDIKLIVLLWSPLKKNLHFLFVRIYLSRTLTKVHDAKKNMKKKLQNLLVFFEIYVQLIFTMWNLKINVQ